MAETTFTSIARLDRDELDNLEEQLALEVRQLTPASHSKVRGTHEVPHTPQRTALEQVAAEIYDNARKASRLPPTQNHMH